ncbi:MAG: glycoside hydrolase domain-containing protein [Kiritimatiellia bacterium]
MKRNKKTIIFLAVGMISLAVNAGTNNDLLFYCNFDGSANATSSRGDGAAKCAVAPEFQQGVRGQAVVIGGSTTTPQQIVGDLPTNTQKTLNCYYKPAGNFDAEKGSVSFWLKPLDWDGKTKGFNVFFRTGIGNDYFMLYKFFSDDRLLFLRGEQTKWTSVNNRIGEWKTGYWHHVVATWSPAEIRLFIDGDMVCASRVRFPPDLSSPVEPLSVGPGGSWEKAFCGRSLLDEFRIHSRPLGKEEVTRLYRQDADSVEIETGMLTIGEKTPALDGRIDDFEYALADMGLSSQSDPQPKGIYSLSYDRSNLYFAVRSGLGRSNAAPAMARDGDFASSERVEIFLDPKAETKPLYRFVLLPEGGIYDSKNGDKDWNSGNARVSNSVASNLWTVEAAIPFADLGISNVPDGNDWRFNIARVFTSPEETVSLAPVKGSLEDRSSFITLVFRPDAPRIRIAGWSDLEKKQTARNVSVQTGNDRSEIKFVSISDTTKPYGLRTTSYSLFANGKSTPYQSPVWRTGQQDFALSESRILEIVEGKITTLYLKKSISEDQSPMKTFFLYTQAQKRLFVSALRRADGTIRARFLKPDGNCAFEAIQPIPKDATYFNALFDMDFEKLVPGDYLIKIDYVAPDGKAIETWEQALRIPRKDDPMFKPYVDPEADKVPAPWVPLKSDNEKVAMWGREYDFSKGFLFSSLVSQGKEILAAPAALRLDGETLAPVGPAGLEKKAGTDMLAEWEKSADLGKLKIESRIRTHFDGYCEVAMTLSPTGKEQVIRSLALDIPLRSEAATLARDSKHCVLGGSKSGAVGDYWSQDFSGGTFVWIGNDSVGFNWLAPNLENWNCRNKAKNVEVIRTNGTALLRFNLVDTPTNWAEARTIKFGFTLTPSRPLDKRIHRLREIKDYQMWCQPWHYFAYPDYDLVDRSAIERAGEGVNDVFLYFGDGLTSPFSPEWTWWEEEWRDVTRGTRTYGEWTGDFNEPKIRNTCCYVEARGETYFNFMQNKRSVFFERAKTPLIPKARNYYFDTGASTADSYREQALNVYRMIRRTGPEAKIYTHQGLLRVMPMQHFTDIICGGEGLGTLVVRDGNYYAELTPEMFRATYSPYIWGMKMVFLDMIVRSFRENYPDKISLFNLKNPETRKPLLHSYGYCVVHDVDIHDSNKESAQLRETIWAAQDKLVWDEQVVFHPYWEQGAVKLVSPQSNRILASAYTKEGKMLLAILNDTDKEQDIRLELDLGKLGLKEGLEGHDVWEPETKYKLASALEAKMQPRGFRLILFDDKQK